MKTPNPLAAALLLIAASAAAQPYAASATGGFNMTGTNSTPFSMTGAAAENDDMLFKCSTPPYIACTTAQMNQRELIRETRTCPRPVSAACEDYLKRNPLRLNPAETIAAFTPPPGQKWASPDCTHIPCRLADDPASAPAVDEIVVTGRRYDQQPGFIGPPAPPINASNSVGMSSDPPAFSPAEFKKELADARKDNPYPIVDLGDNRYGVVTPDGEVQVCGKGICAGTRDPSRIPNFQDQVQLARAESVGFTGASGGGQTNKGAPSTPGINNAGQTGSPNQADDTNPSDEAKGMGRQAAADSVAVSGTSGSSGGGSSVASSGSSSGGATAAEVIKTKAASLGSIEITYTRLQKTEDDIKGAAGAFSNGQMTGFASPNAPAPSGRLAEPPVDEKYLGKIQASSNE